MIWSDPTHWPTDPPTYPPIGGGVSTNHKSSNRIELSWLVQVLLNFDWFWGSPPWWGGRCMDGDGGGYGCVGDFPCMHAYTQTHTHTCTCMLNMINMDVSMLVAICNFCSCIHVLACMSMHVHMCEDTPNASRHPHPSSPSPELQEVQKAKIQ